MRKMKKINGFLVVRFNDREKRVYPALGNFGVIDAEQYVGDIDYDLGEMEYTDAETIEIAVEQARGLNSEEDFGEEPTTYAVITETAAASQETTVAPKAFVMAYENKLKTQVKSDHYPDIDPRTAAHELSGYKAALCDLGLLDEDDEVTEPDIFGEACQFYGSEAHRAEITFPTSAGPVVLSPHDYEEGETFTGCTVQTLKCRRCGAESFIWSKRPGPEQEEAQAMQEGPNTPGKPVAKLHLSERFTRQLQQFSNFLQEMDEYVTGESEPEAPERVTFMNIPAASSGHKQARRVYALGLALAEECPDNDCRLYLNVFNMARELDTALDEITGYPAEVMRRELNKHYRELGQMYYENYAVQQYKEEMKS